MAASILSPTPSTQSFNDFFTARDEVKRGLYRRVVFISLMVVFLSGFLAVVGLVFIDRAQFFHVLQLLGWLLVSAGICVASTVPVDELDLDEELGRRICLRRTVCLFLGIAFFFFGLLVTTLEPYVMGVPVFLLSATLLLHNEEGRVTRGRAGRCAGIALVAPFRAPLTLKMALVLIVGIAVDCHFFLLMAWRPQSFSDNAVAQSFFATFAASLAAHAWASQLLLTLGGLVMLALALGAIVNWLRFSRHAQLRWGAWALPAHPGWCTTAFYVTLYIFMATQVVLFCTLLAWTVVVGEKVTPTLPGGATLLLLPMVVTQVVGRRRIFTLLARWFEFDLSRQQRDGALLASLVSSSTVLDRSNNVRWIQRRTQVHHLAPLYHEKDFVDRSLWMRGDIVAEVKGPHGSTL